MHKSLRTVKQEKEKEDKNIAKNIFVKHRLTIITLPIENSEKKRKLIFYNFLDCVGLSMNNLNKIYISLYEVGKTLTMPHRAMQLCKSFKCDRNLMYLLDNTLNLQSEPQDNFFGRVLGFFNIMVCTISIKWPIISSQTMKIK